nr:putative reverse transcriptase domain-containing protein [Tanacetum cinerariifolium]
MDAPPSPNHVFNFPEAEFEEDPQEEPKEEVEEGPEEDTEDDASIIENEALQMPPVGSAYEVGGSSSVTPFPPFHMHGSEIARLDGNTELLLSNVQYLERHEKKRKVDMEACSSEIREGKKRMDKMEQDLGDEMQFSNVVEHRVTDLENREQEKDGEMVKVKKHLGTLEANYSLVLSDRDEWRRAFLNLQALVFERLGRGAWDARPDVGDNGPVSFGESKPPKPPGSPSRSFDVIVGMDWLSYHRAVIVCYEKIVRIPLPNGEILEIHGEKPEKYPKSLSCIKADEVRLDDIRTVCDFPEVFTDDLTGLHLVHEIEFRIDLIPGALPVVKLPYRLAPSEMQEL